MSRQGRLMDILAGVVSGRLHTLRSDLTEITLDVLATDYFDVAKQLRDHEGLRFEQLVDLCGVDNAGYGGNAKPNGRFAVVAHLLSVTNNWRVRLRTYVPDDTCPVVRSLCDVWSSASWYEREAFDLFGIVFEGHPDLRRILTDYDFVGHPLRKDFPVSGFMEMTYDKEQGRVVYQQVSIEPRENTLRVVREDTYGGLCA